MNPLYEPDRFSNKNLTEFMLSIRNVRLQSISVLIRAFQRVGHQAHSNHWIRLHVIRSSAIWGHFASTLRETYLSSEESIPVSMATSVSVRTTLPRRQIEVPAR